MSRATAITAGGAAFLAWFIGAQFNKPRRIITVDGARRLVRNANIMFGGKFAEADVLAIIDIESAFNIDAQRFEITRGEASIGLMQVLFSTAVDRGLTGQGPAALFDPQANVFYGMAQLQWSLEFLTEHFGREPSIDEWIGSYNAGVGNVMRGNIPLAYVVKWRAARAKYV